VSFALLLLLRVARARVPLVCVSISPTLTLDSVFEITLTTIDSPQITYTVSDSPPSPTARRLARDRIFSILHFFI
jgi:hypothetical protein